MVLKCIDVSEAKGNNTKRMEQADDTLSDISDFIKTLIKGKEDDLSVKGTNSLFKLSSFINSPIYSLISRLHSLAVVFNH